MALHSHWLATGKARSGRPFPTSWRGRKMATPLGWSQEGSGSVCLPFDQLRDVIESQEELIHQLRNVVCSHSSGKVRNWTPPPRGRGQALFKLGGVARIQCGGRHPGGGAHWLPGAEPRGAGLGVGGSNACLNLTQIRQCSPLCLVAEGTQEDAH